jgi:hypothetical protein
MNFFLDAAGVPYDGLLAEAVDDSEDNIMTEKMLDGSYAVQKIGDPSGILDMVFYCSRETRRAIQLAKSRADLVSVSWRGVTYAGYMSDLTFESFWPKIEHRQNKLKIKLLLEGET